MTRRAPADTKASSGNPSNTKRIHQSVENSSQLLNKASVKTLPASVVALIRVRLFKDHVIRAHNLQILPADDGLVVMIRELAEKIGLVPARRLSMCLDIVPAVSSAGAALHLCAIVRNITSSRRFEAILSESGRAGRPEGGSKAPRTRRLE